MQVRLLTGGDPHERLVIARILRIGQEASMFVSIPIRWQHLGLLSLLVLTAAGCRSDNDPVTYAAPTEGPCELDSSSAAPNYLRRIQCRADFMALAAQPIDADLPGAASVKVALDLQGSDALYFQNSKLYAIHYEFVRANLADAGTMSAFNAANYYTPNRRFLLGAITYYEGPKAWALEIAPYDTASVPQITKLFNAVRQVTWFGTALAFHPTSDTVQARAAALAKDIKLVTTDELYAAIDYQPLSLGSTIGRLRFTTAQQLNSEYLPYDSVVVLDESPVDLSVVRGVITQAFQTPLSHVNVLAHNRHMPNMGLRNALTNSILRGLEGQLVALTVAADRWNIRAATQAEADAYGATHAPTKVVLPPVDLSATALTNIEDVTPETPQASLSDDLIAAIRRFGGKAAHYSILAKTPNVPHPTAFAIPIYFYDQFMTENGFYDRVRTWLSDSDFSSNSDVRNQRLLELRKAMMAAPVNTAFTDALLSKLGREYPQNVMRFRSSTNSEDLAGFPCAGCYESHSGDPAVPGDVLAAVRRVWASMWLFSTFELRQYYAIDHFSAGMGVLVHHRFATEAANGVAVTSNPFDLGGVEPAFYVNVQFGDAATVVSPPTGTTSDQLLYFFAYPDQPTRYLSHSNLIPDGATVLTPLQLYSLGVALDALHKRFKPAYQSDPTQWYGMDVEFKFDSGADPSQPPALVIKQARPYPSVGSANGDG